ncbi:hypothetical protein [Chryseobacterium defluvii]|uniref:Uncharacterized protein n=1 Tax=Chryseobacterium defluvii TaxID=160396 RepID=A0A495SKS0_9FLAO|nr:hypothetical protein [Chryseobacterium defluvii]RKT00879.1 hypothetical protein BCF58_0080 [Chryseobacterium defluvii]
MDAKKTTKRKIKRPIGKNSLTSPGNKTEISNSFFHRIISLLKKEELI